MILVSKTVEFDAGHRVHRHGGKCAHLHGHRWKVEAVVQGPVHDDESSEHGMVIDFGLLKAVLASRAEELDHRMILAADDPWLVPLAELDDRVMAFPYTPTAENIARWFVDRLPIPPPLVLRSVSVYETPTSQAVVLC